MRVFGLLLIALCCCLGGVGQSFAQGSNAKVSAPKFLGVWTSKSAMSQKEVDMLLEGQKHFLDLNQVEDNVTWSYIYKELTRIPMVFTIRTQSTWRIRDQYL